MVLSKLDFGILGADWVMMLKLFTGQLTYNIVFISKWLSELNHCVDLKQTNLATKLCTYFLSIHDEKTPVMCPPGVKIVTFFSPPVPAVSLSALTMPGM